jgi:hypothetical protein
MSACITFLIITWQLWGLRDRLLRITAKVSENDGAHAHAVLVIALSIKQADDPIAKSKTYKNWDALLERAMLVTKADASDWLDPLRTICDKNWGYWNWQQPLRIILHDLEKMNSTPSQPLRRIILLGSDKSVALIPEFKSMLQPVLDRCPSGKIELHADDPEIDLQSIETACEKLTGIVESNKDLIKNRRICIDVTGATAIYSIAASLTTLNRKMVFSYVNNDGKPVFYDASVSGVENDFE